MLSNFVALYIDQNSKANIAFLVDTIRNYSKLYIQKLLAQQEAKASGEVPTQNATVFPMFNMTDYYLMNKIISHPMTNSQVVSTLLEMFKNIILTDKFYDYSTLNFVVKYLVKLSVKHQGDLLPQLKQVFQSCCFTLTKLDIQIHRLQNAVKKDLMP